MFRVMKLKHNIKFNILKKEKKNMKKNTDM